MTESTGDKPQVFSELGDACQAGADQPDDRIYRFGGGKFGTHFVLGAKSPPAAAMAVLSELGATVELVTAKEQNAAMRAALAELKAASDETESVPVSNR